MTSPEQLKAWIDAPEGTRLEFKSAVNEYQFDKLVEYAVAIANEGGGQIILGVTDRRPRKVVGTAAFAEPGRTEAGLHQRLSHRIPVEEIHYEGHRVLIVHVPSRLPGTAWSINGRYLKRAGDDLVGLSDTELRQIFAETGPDYSAEPCRASLEDLDTAALALFRNRWARRSGNPRIEQLTERQLLTDTELLVDGTLTIAALILLGKRSALGKYLGQAEVVFEYRSSEASGPAQDRQEYREGFLLFQDSLWQRIDLRNDRQSYQDGFFRYDISTFDEVSVREAILNAVAHRDYRHGGSVFIRQYARRLEIVSPGGFPPGIDPGNIIDRQNPRNRRLAESLARCGYVERSGQGMNLMVESAVRQSKPLPSFTGSSPHEVHLTLDGTMGDPAFVRFIEKLGEQLLRSFSTHDFLALDAINRELPLSGAVRSRLPGLIDAGAIEKRGEGRGARFHLSRSLYAAMGRKGTYTRHRGLDHETNKALLLKHIVDAGEEGAPMTDLLQVLPALSRSQVKRLLGELSSESRARVVGVTRAARWYAVTIGSTTQDEPM